MRGTERRLTEYENALVFRANKEKGLSQVEIATMHNKSTAFVSKCLSLLDLPNEIQVMIQNGEIAVKAAKEITSFYPTERAQIKAAKAAVTRAREQGRDIATNKEVMDALKDQTDAKLISEHLRFLADKIGSETINVLELAEILDETKSVKRSIRKYKHNQKNVQ